MGKAKRVAACFLVGALCATAGVTAAACGRRGDDGDDTEKFKDKTPYELRVWNFEGGYGSEWLRELEKRYEDERMDKTFTVDGKTYDSVNVKIEAVKLTMDSMASSFSPTNHVYFQEQVPYTSYVREKKILEDMTEVLTTPNPYEGGVTLESKLTDEQKEYYNINGHYYGIPHYAGYVGLIYNQHLFNERGYYLKDGYSYSGDTADLVDCFTDVAAEKTAGPDGQKGTSDDGLPTTYDEFFMLCGMIYQDGEDPIEWLGEQRNKQLYLNWFLTSLIASYEGLEQMSLNYSFNGTATDLVSVDGSGNVTKLAPVEITSENGYELAKQAGKYYGLSFLERIVDEGWNYSGSLSHTGAQDDFIRGRDVNGSDKYSAMLVEGVWWEMEASATFNLMQQSANENYRNRFAWMPLPCATQEKAAERATKLQAGQKGYTLLDTHNSLCFIGKGISSDAKKIAVDFIQFAYTDTSLSEFSRITDTTKAIRYSVSPSDKAAMSTFGKTLVDMQEKSEIVFGFSKESFFQNNETTLTKYLDLYNSRMGSLDSTVAVDEFAKGVSAKQYFDGLYTRWLSQWQSLAK